MAVDWRDVQEQALALLLARARDGDVPAAIFLVEMAQEHLGEESEPEEVAGREVLVGQPGFHCPLCGGRIAFWDAACGEPATAKCLRCDGRWRQVWQRGDA